MGPAKLWVNQPGISWLAIPNVVITRVSESATAKAPIKRHRIFNLFSPISKYMGSRRQRWVGDTSCLDWVIEAHNIPQFGQSYANLGKPGVDKSKGFHPIVTLRNDSQAYNIDLPRFFVPFQKIAGEKSPAIHQLHRKQIGCCHKAHNVLKYGCEILFMEPG